MKKVRVRLVKGLAGTKQGHRDTARGLGLKKINQVVELQDSPAVRGMINRINYLVRIEDWRMRLNTLKPAPGAKKDRHRVGRGVGSGWGKTAGRGHKGQKARSGGFHKRGFEGGQMPLHRRLPKRGFNSPSRDDVAEVRLGELDALPAGDVDLAALQAAGIVSSKALGAKIILSGKLSKKLTIKGDVKASKGARAAIEELGGKVEVLEAPAPVKKLPKKAEGAAKA